jgi:hypothetical protein
MTRTDPAELARMKQRQFYLDMAERFTKMADEYDPIRYAQNPLPIHGFTTVIVAHGSDHLALYREIRMLAMDWSHAVTDIHAGRHSVRLERIYPEQTENGYRLDLEAWARARRGARR